MTAPAKTARTPLDESAAILRFLNSLPKPFPITGEIFQALLAAHYAELQQQAEKA